MKFKEKELKDIVVTLPFADGTEEDYGVFAAFEVEGKEYLALLPLLDQKTLDYSQSYTLYRAEEDAEGNPVVVYIESDLEYAKAAAYFADHFLPRNDN